MSPQHASRLSRRRFLGGLTLVGTAGLLSLPPRSGAAEPPPETTKIKLYKYESICIAPQYVAEEFLRGEGFTEVHYVEAGAGDGLYPLGPMTVRVTDGVARVLGQDGAIAGSTLTMERAVARTVDVAGVPIADAVTAASHTPARALGLADRVGSIAAGKQADLLLLDEKMAVCKVMVKGRWQSSTG